MPDLLDTFVEDIDTTDLLDQVASEQPQPQIKQQQLKTAARLNIQDSVNGLDAFDMALQTPRVDREQGAIVAGLFTSSNYQKAVEERRQEKKEMGTEGYFEELLDAVARGIVRVGSGAGELIAAQAEGARPFVMRTIEEAEQSKKTAEAVRRDARFLWNVAQNPDLAAQDKGAANKVINMIGETIPYITATTAASIAAGPAGGFVVGFMVEGNNAYQGALDDGVNPDTARMIGLGVGIVSGAIETIGGAIVGEVLERAMKKISNKAVQAGAIFTVGTFTEALEEASQEVAAITGESVYKDVDWEEAVHRTLGAAAGGAFLGGAMKGLSVGVGRITQGGSTDELIQTVNEIDAFEDQVRAEQEAAQEPTIAPKPTGEPKAAAKPSVTPELAKQVPAAKKKPVVPFVGKQAKTRAQEQVQTSRSSEIQERVTEVVETDFTSKATEKKLSDLTSARQAMIAEDRSALGQDTVNSKGRRAWEQAQKQAIEKNIPAKAQRLADAVNAEPRALSDIETAGMVIRATELKNEHNAARKSMRATEEEATIVSQSAEINRIETEFESLSRAIDLSGTEKGRALVAQKLTINRDFDLVSVKTRAKVSKGKALSEQESAKLESLTTKLEEANAHIDALTTEVAENKAMKNLKVARTARGFAQMSETQRNSNLAELANDVNTLIRQGCAN